MSTPERALSFGSVAAEYDRVRPSYPADAVNWLTSGVPGCSVLDVGAGTGKMSCALVAAGFTVTAVEPDPGMRSVLSLVPGVTTLVGTGEKLPLADACVDAVIYAQAWHWTDHELATAEAVRVLRPGGLLGLAWNVEDGSVPWVAELGQATGDSVPPIGDVLPDVLPDALSVVPPVAGLDPLEQATFRWSESLSVDDLVALAATWSWVSTLPDERRVEVLSEVRSIALREAVEGAVSLPRLCVCIRARRT